MTIPTALAPTVDLATPRIEAHAEKIRAALQGTITKFYTCEPGDMRVEDRQGNKWIEGSWGLHVRVRSFAWGDIPDIQALSSTIGIGDISFKPANDQEFELIFWLTARVMR